LLLATAIVTWLINDTERVRHGVENFISEVSKRPFSIEGEFDYNLGRTIAVRASKIRWGNAPDSRSPYMLEVEQLTGSVDLSSLFERPVVITYAHVTNATLLFEWVRDRSFNWWLLHPNKRVPKTTPPRNPLPLVIDQGSIRRVRDRRRVSDRQPDIAARAGCNPAIAGTEHSRCRGFHGAVPSTR
jgi:uncharacterized protein involved in outer membrane biogenesis